jgi:acetyltransferase-like isoleucine patch superfamily enzyme
MRTITTLLKLIFKPLQVIGLIRSYYYSLKIDNQGGKIIFINPLQKIKLVKKKGAKIHVHGNLIIQPHVRFDGPVLLYVGKNATFSLDGDFSIGQNTKIVVGPQAILQIGGKRNASVSAGITSDSFIMVNKSITIGYDFICAWNVFISDSDWHKIEGQNHQADVVIGDKVWIANNVNVLKGTKIGNGSIVASNTKVINKEYPDKVLISGPQGRVVRENVNWSPEI